ncbi:PspC domain-containing protein [Radiobacillus deserti]|uniref:PspC domain-containing protein n=1 Tax=Radiobacillus deserti TaxID=2594883 RepID=A0A516KIN2_9BACI|nr:PspC domain-containing protein [Radiobacillus deserti]QDP41249.1 PspC domain-containing protein [Radiobacillus deserti]
MKKLLRTRNDRYIAGVLGGIAKYFGIDATLVRLVFVVLLFLTYFCSAILYLLCCCFYYPK